MAFIKLKSSGSFLKKLRDKYRLVIYNDNTFEEVLQFRLSRLNLISLFGSFVIFLIISTILLVSYTPLREFIPGYPDADMRRNIVLNAIKIDSLQLEMQTKEQYLKNVHIILAGGTPENIEYEETHDTTSVYTDNSPIDSALREQIELDEKLNVNNRTKQKSTKLSGIQFFAPVKGMVTNTFDYSKNHIGVDIVSGSNEVVKSTLDGVVTLATWTLETGFIIQVQHENNLVSIYKHNANLLKKVGDKVSAGEPIAIIGNSGELTTGPHLHFEIWYNGNPLNPEDFIVF